MLDREVLFDGRVKVFWHLGSVPLVNTFEILNRLESAKYTEINLHLILYSVFGLVRDLRLLELQYLVDFRRSFE